jgi:hypothetical protein
MREDGRDCPAIAFLTRRLAGELEERDERAIFKSQGYCLKNSATVGFSFIDLSSPYFRKTARDGSKHMIGEVVSSSRSTKLSNPVEETRITPQTTARTPDTGLTKAP